jgi:hypothetical protein
MSRRTHNPAAPRANGCVLAGAIVLAGVAASGGLLHLFGTSIMGANLVLSHALYYLAVALPLIALASAAFVRERVTVPFPFPFSSRKPSGTGTGRWTGTGTGSNLRRAPAARA